MDALLGSRPELTLLGIAGCIVVAMANGANDIANSVGTSYGAGALTLRQAIVFGAAAEFAGALSLGSFVAKTISKGVIEPAAFAADGCPGVLEYALGMVAVLAGTGSTTLLATLYGLPISASHGVIGGLVAVGIASHGVASLGLAPLVSTVVAWVASPLLGSVTAALVHFAVNAAVHDHPDPARRAHTLQPVLVAVTVAIAAAFLVVAGPSVLRIQPLALGLGVSGAVGGVTAGCTVLVSRYRLAHRRSMPLFGGVGSAATSRSDASEHSDASDGAGQQLTESVDSMRDKGVISDEEEVRSAGSSTRAAQPAAAAAEEAPFVPLLILSALTVAFAHGANDLGNSIGPLAAILTAGSGGDITAQPSIPLWLLTLGSVGFVVGIGALGANTIRTVGSKITTLTPSRSYAVQMGTAVAVLSSTVLGLAVSTSHCLVGAVIGVGLVGKLRGPGDGAELNMAMLTKILIGWAVTIPLAMAVSVVTFELLLPWYGSDDPVCAGAAGAA